MYTPLEFDRARFEAYARTVLAPAIYQNAMKLEASALQCDEPISHAEAISREYKPVQIGWGWGPVWSTAWFHLAGRVPDVMKGRCVTLRFSSGTEALAWRDGAPWRGFDVNRDSLVLFPQAAGGEEIDLHIEAACNHPFGISTFSWDPPETHHRWSSEKPGELQRCEIADYHHDAWRLYTSFQFALQLLAELPEESPRAQQLARGMLETMRIVDDTNVRGSAATALEVLQPAIGNEAAGAATQCYAVGHAHIDTAWLWPLRETRRKCLRSFANVLELMERYPDFVFLCSQAQQYAYVEQDAPQLFERIAQRVREGRWEPNGAMWIEPDANVPSGESLVRQILHGTRYWRRKFGDAGRQRFVYLPDTFGFPAVLPQLMAQSGLDTFITNKLSWNHANDWPDVNFIWRGLDGSEVLAHCTPGHDYNATNTPAELRRGEKNNARKDRMQCQAWLQPFGYGDGGGGPTAEMLERAELAKSAEGLPRVTLSRADDFCEQLHRRRRELEESGGALPVWDGELYLELHRGTLTTHAWLKRANRRAETSLRLLELLLVGGPEEARGTHRDEDLRRELDEIWKLLLLNQFHDILPGSSITKVYEDARRDFDRIESFYSEQLNRALNAWAETAETKGLEQPVLVVNPGSSERRGVVEVEGRAHYVQNLAAAGATVVDLKNAGAAVPVQVGGGRLSNGLLEATIDDAGQITSLIRFGRERDARAATDMPFNQLVLYEDVPHAWDAWEIDPTYVEKPFPVQGPAESWRVVEESPLRCAIEVERPLGRASRITQRFVLETGSPRLDVQTEVDWHEERRLLRAYFPVDVRTTRATYGTQFGCIERPAHRNTPWDRARFEVCAHGWMDLSEPGFGVALLDDCKYGHSCAGNVMGLTLLRSPKHPDPQADMGRHVFTYSLMPHHGDWRQAGVDREAEALNNPLIARPLPKQQEGTWSRQHAPVEIKALLPGRVEIAALKPAEEGDGVVLRLVETHGGRGEVRVHWRLPVREVQGVNLLEELVETPALNHDEGDRITTFLMKPFQVVTLRARLA